MKRRQDWPVRLDAAVEAARAEPFAYGRHDCLLFALTLVEAMTGEDAAAAWRGLYDSAAGAAFAQRKYAGLGLAATLERVAQLHGWAEVAPAFAQRGDVALMLEGEEPAAGVVLGAQVVIADHVAGWQLRPTLRALRAWRIG